jgi:hypothetical protein
MLRRIIIIFGYISLVLTIVVFTAALVAYGNDYSYDFSTHRIIQKGHVIIDSLPSGVQITEDGKLLKKKTPYQAAYKVGEHTFGLVKDGFWPWQKVLKVVAGRVTLANYVIFVPKQPVTTVLDSRLQITAQSISKDHRHLAYITGGIDPAVYTLDIGSKKVVKLYTPKAAAPPVAAEVMRDVAWSDDASHLLLTSDIGGQPTHRLAEASGGTEPQNLTQSFGFNLTGLKFSGSNWHQLYWVSPDGLRRLDVGSNTVSSVLADKVTQFWIQNDRVLYAAQTDLGRSLWSLDSKDKRQEIIQALVDSDTYDVSLARYNGEDELAVVPSKTGIATLYSGIFGDTPVAKVVAKGVTGVNFAPDGHLLALTSPTTVSVYDLESSFIDNTFVLYTAANQTGTLTSLTWFDSAHILAIRDGALYWSEYDGANSVNLGKTYGILPAYASGDTRSIVMYSPTQTEVKITLLQIH